MPDPISNRYRFKLGVAFAKKTGESVYKNDLDKMSFAPAPSSRPGSKAPDFLAD